MSSQTPSLQLLAKTLGLSRTTVSDALRGKGRVSPETVERVRECAQKLGYQPNPLIATVLGSINRGRGTGFRGALAVIDIHENSHWPHGPFPRELVCGVKQRAEEMGFSIAEFVVGPEVLPWRRLDAILQSRGISGIIVLPAWANPDLSQIDWSRYAGIYTDVTSTPELHSVCSDHYGSMLSLIRQVRRRGYRRPGLIIQRARDLRIGGRQSAAFCAAQNADPEIERVPPLITAEYPEFGNEFGPWFSRYQPDVLLSHFPESRDWMRAVAPDSDSGFVLLNNLEHTFPCAALDLQPHTLGARAVELLVGQIVRNELGVPAWPSRSMVEARWVEGPTIRPPDLASTEPEPMRAG